MPINNPTVTPTVRHPRLRILYNGKSIGGAIEAEVSNNNYYQADTFTAHFALNEDPNFGLSWWGAQDKILIDIQSSLDGGQSWVSHLIGEIDHMSGAVENGVLSVEGRDLTARFIDNKTQEAFLNKTSSEVVQELASRRGLTADVTPTTTPVGRYYSADHDRISLGEFVRSTTEWNLLCSLAQHEQFDIWVTGTTVHFHPSTPLDSDPYVLVWSPTPATSNSMSIRLERSLTVAKDVVVAVRSWNSNRATEITKFAPSGARQAAIQSGKAQQFTITVPNLTPQQAQDLANRMREDITRNERILTFSAPADQTLTARMMVHLQGTSSSWDQAYYTDWVRRTLSLQRGFHMDVRCKNHSPQSSAIATL
jgi:phage protein D